MPKQKFEAQCLKHLDAIVRDFPSLICFEFQKCTRMIAFHGAIHKSRVSDLTTSLLRGLSDVKVGAPVSVSLKRSTCESIEWCDYSVSDQHEKKKRSTRKSVSRVHTDRLLQNIEAVFSQGGHQDLIECVGLVGDKSIAGNKSFHVSPFYKKSSHLYVFKDFCNLEKDACTDVEDDQSKVVSVSSQNPTILKTSIAYTCKETVNGTSYITVFEDGPGSLSVDCRVFVKQIGEYDEYYKAKDWSRINTWTWNQFRQHVQDLPLVMSDDVDKAYENPNYKTVGKRALQEIMDSHQMFNAKDCVMVFKVSKECSKVISVGDIHSNIHGFCDVLSKLATRRLFSNFKLHDSVVLLLLGDYGDRGPYGLLVHWLILKLRRENPTRFLTIRGNHETHHLWRGTGMEREFYDMND